MTLLSAPVKGQPSDVVWSGLRNSIMTIYTVGMKLRARTRAVTIEAEDALLAALKIKLENPEALVTYVRKSNRRGDRRHPHESLSVPSNK